MAQLLIITMFVIISPSLYPPISIPPSLYHYPSISLSSHFSITPSLNSPISLFLHLPIPPSLFPSVSLSLRLSIPPSLYPFVSLSLKGRILAMVLTLYNLKKCPLNLILTVVCPPLPPDTTTICTLTTWAQCCSLQVLPYYSNLTTYKLSLPTEISTYILKNIILYVNTFPHSVG